MRIPYFALLVTCGAFAGIACGGTAESKDPSSSNSAVQPGASCPTIGASEPAADGCNTCTCTESGWACTEIACDPGCSGGSCATDCTDGDTKPSDDGCNTCSCSGGVWLCTLQACEPACTEGEIVPAPDGCNTCVCAPDGSLACTKKACPEPEPGTGCGGWLGDTCAEDEYCAYEEGQYCGAADASSTCQKRPEGCILSYQPVCGCDGKDYGNACEAAMAGTGVNTSGTCEAPLGGPK